MNLSVLQLRFGESQFLSTLKTFYEENLIGWENFAPN